MKKSIFFILLAAILILVFSACHNTVPDKTGGTEAPIQTESSSSAENTKTPEGTSAPASSAEEKTGTEAGTSGQDEAAGSSEQTAESSSEEETTEAASSSEEDPEYELHLTDGILFKYLVEQEEVYLVVHPAESGNQPGLPDQIIELVGFSPEMEKILLPLKSGTRLDLVIYHAEAEGLYPLPARPLDIVYDDLAEPECDLALLKSLADLGYSTLLDCEKTPRFLLMSPLPEWQDYPVSYEYSEDGRIIDVYYDLQREGEDTPVRFTLFSFALETSADLPGGDIGYATVRLPSDDWNYLYMGLPRYAYNYITDQHDFYFYPEKDNWDNEIKVTLTDEELKTLIMLQTGFDDTIDYDELRSRYQKALEADDTEAMTAVDQFVFKADEYLTKVSWENLTVCGLSPVY